MQHALKTVAFAFGAIALNYVLGNPALKVAQMVNKNAA